MKNEKIKKVSKKPKTKVTKKTVQKISKYVERKEFCENMANLLSDLVQTNIKTATSFNKVAKDIKSLKRIVLCLGTALVILAIVILVI